MEKLDRVTFYIVRHGQSEANLHNVLAGHSDYKLTELGRKQAEKVAEYFKDIEVDEIYSSPLLRPKETIMPTAKAKNLKINEDKRFIEVFFGSWEDKTKDWLKANVPDYEEWLKLPATFIPKDGETCEHAGARFREAIEEIAVKSSGKSIVIASHAEVILTFLCNIGYFHKETATLDCLPANASVTKVIYDSGKFNVVEYSHSSHLGTLMSARLGR